eukprot:762667-Hanusia_phi.AAC.11
MFLSFLPSQDQESGLIWIGLGVRAGSWVQCGGLDARSKRLRDSESVRSRVQSRYNGVSPAAPSVPRGRVRHH